MAASKPGKRCRSPIWPGWAESFKPTGLAGIGMIERRRKINGKTASARAFSIGSRGTTTAESFAQAARSHCGIENSLHGMLDVPFREDDCRVRKDHAPHNFAALRKCALALLHQG